MYSVERAINVKKKKSASFADELAASTTNFCLGRRQVTDSTTTVVLILSSQISYLCLRIKRTLKISNCYLCCFSLRL